MTGIDSYSITPATNATADGGAINWAEGQPPSSVNNTARQWMADERARQNDLIWFQYGTGDQGAGNLAVPSVYSSGTAFTITGADVTTVYNIGRRVRAVGSGTGTIYGTISSSSYNSGNSTTTINVTWDSGSLSNETLVISLSQIPVTGNPVPNAAPYGFIGGLTLSTAGSSGTFGIAAGSATNSSGTQIISLPSAITKTTGSFTAGTGNGSLDTGSIANTTWYHAFVISGPGKATDGLTSLSATPALPSGYTIYRRAGSMLTDGSAHWVAFSQFGNDFLWSVAVNDCNQVVTTTPSLITLTTPLGVKTFARMNGFLGAAAVGSSALINSPDQTAVAVASPTGNFNMFYNPTNQFQATNFQIRTNTSSQVRAVADAQSPTVVLTTYGWVDLRGSQ